MEAKRAVKWAAYYRGIATLSFIVGMGIAFFGLSSGLGEAIDIVINNYPAQQQEAQEAANVPLAAGSVVVGVVVWQLGKALGFYWTLGSAVDEATAADGAAGATPASAPRPEPAETEPAAGAAPAGGAGRGRDERSGGFDEPASGSAEPAGGTAAPAGEPTDAGGSAGGFDEPTAGTTDPADETAAGDRPGSDPAEPSDGGDPAGASGAGEPADSSDTGFSEEFGAADPEPDTETRTGTPSSADDGSTRTGTAPAEESTDRRTGTEPSATGGSSTDASTTTGTDDAGTDDAPEGVACPDCGYPNKDDVSFCMNCGAEL